MAIDRLKRYAQGGVLASDEKAAPVVDEGYWERRCKNAEDHLQEIALELDKINGTLVASQNTITAMEHEVHVLRAQLDIVHLIFGSR